MSLAGKHSSRMLAYWYSDRKTHLPSPGSFLFCEIAVHLNRTQKMCSRQVGDIQCLPWQQTRKESFQNNAEKKFSLFCWELSQSRSWGWVNDTFFTISFYLRCKPSNPSKWEAGPPPCLCLGRQVGGWVGTGEKLKEEIHHCMIIIWDHHFQLLQHLGKGFIFFAGSFYIYVCFWCLF